MAASSIYATGTVTVSANDTAVTGVGTAWVAAGVLPGALLFVEGLARPLVVRSVISDVSIVLDLPAPGAATDAPYVMVRLGSDARLVELLSRLLAQQSAAFDLDGEDKSLLLTTDGGTVTTGFATETTGEGRWRYGLVDGDLDTFRFQRWNGTAWADVFTVDRATGVTTWDAAPTETTAYMESLVAEVESLRAQFLASVSETIVAAGGSIAAAPYALDGLLPSVIASGPAGVMSLNGAYVQVTDLLTFSSASKRVIGPTGTLDTVAANQPAWDWSTGRRRLLIEAVAATKYAPASEAMGATPWSKTGCTVATGAVVGPDGSAGLSVVTEDTSTGFHSISASTGAYVAAAGEFWSCRVVVKNVSGTARYVRAALTGPPVANTYAAVNADLVTGLVKSTSGIANARLSPAANGTWLLEFTAETVASGTVGVLFASVLTTYASSYAGDGSSAWAIGYMNLEKVAKADAFCSSYVAVPTTSAVTRIADDVRLSAAALAQANAPGGATVVFRGKLQSAVSYGRILGGVGSDTAVMIREGANAGIGISSSAGGAWAYGGASLFADFGVCAAYSSAAKKISKMGAAVVTNATGFPTLSGLRVLGGYYGGSCNGWVDEILIWPFIGSDAGIVAQAHAYGA